MGWAEPMTRGSAVASEAFLPFADGLLSMIAAGATAVIQPGGSMRDEEVIAAATSMASPWSSPACATSGTDILRMSSRTCGRAPVFFFRPFLAG